MPSCSPCGCYDNITLTTQTGLSFNANDFVQLYDGVNSYIWGEIVSYNSGTGELVLKPCQFCGDAGVITNWTITLSGIPGTSGTSGIGSEAISVCSISGTAGTFGTSGTSGIDVDLIDKAQYIGAVYNYNINDKTNFQTGILTVAWNSTTNAVVITQAAQATIGTVSAYFFAKLTGSNVVLSLVTNNTTTLWNTVLTKTTLLNCPVSFIMTEDNNFIITEDNNFIITE